MSISKRKHITSDQLEEVYCLGCKFAAKKLKLSEVLEVLVGSLDMNKASATNYMRNFVAFSEGKVYKRAMSALSYEIFLSHFYADLDHSKFEKILASVTLHLEYRWSRSKVKHKAVRGLMDLYGFQVASTSN